MIGDTSMFPTTRCGQNLWNRHNWLYLLFLNNIEIQYIAAALCRCVSINQGFKSGESQVIMDLQKVRLKNRLF